jgi:hypothetical protein
MHDKEKVIREKRELDAVREGIMGLDGKYGTIVRNLGQPIIAHGGGALYESTTADYLDIYGEVEEEEIPTIDEDVSVQELGWHWDGLKFGIHAEIRYLIDKKELLVTWQGFPVYAEVQGELEAYNPTGEWQEKLEPVYRMAKRKEAQYRHQVTTEKRQESRAASLSWLEQLRQRWGI